jgi:hypothetical protein
MHAAAPTILRAPPPTSSTASSPTTTGWRAALAWQVRWLRTADASGRRPAARLGRARAGGVGRRPVPEGDGRERLAWDRRTEPWRVEGGRHFTPEDHPDWVAAVNEVLGAGTTG